VAGSTTRRRKENRRPDCEIGPWRGLGSRNRLPNGGGGFGFAEFLDDAELLQHAESVPIDPAFDHFAVGEAGKADSGNGELLTGRSNAVEIALVCPVAGPTGGDGFAFGGEILDGQAKVGERIAVDGNTLFFAFGAAAGVRRRRVVMSVGWREEFIGNLLLTLVPNFVKKTADNILVGIRQSISPILENSDSARAKRVGLEWYGL
jgi:hypothetical protein